MTTTYPRAQYVPVKGERHDPPLDVVAGVIWHLSASEAPSLRRYFDGPSGGVESHLHIPRGPEHPIEQYRDTDREADANYRGNSWLVGSRRHGFLSMEFQGADPNTGRYTDYQIQEGLAFCDWAQKRYGFARQVADSYRGQGIGFHVMWGTGRGSASWSNAAGKVCPGGPRIRQFYDVIVPAFLGQSVVDIVVPEIVVPRVRPTTPPPFPLPRGWYFGPRSGPRESVSGYHGNREHLRKWQERMDVRGWRIVADGLYGPGTADVARKFQKQCKIAQDGLIGSATWGRAWTEPVT